MASINTSAASPENLALLQAAVSARLVSWQAIRALEQALVPGEISDKAAEVLQQQVDVIASEFGEPDMVASCVDDEYLRHVLAQLKKA